MRLHRTLALGLLAVLLSVSAAFAADAPTSRNFGTVFCPQKFSCSGTDVNQIATMANNCSVRGFGISAQQSGIYDGAMLDSNNCLNGQLPATGDSGRAMVPQCCVSADGDVCSMSCQLLMY